jgi:AcrR family transcriptional regulator
MIARGTDAVPIRELAEAANVSERTFYRFFPRKEDCLRPLVRDARSIYLAMLEANAHKGWRVATVEAFRASAGGVFRERTRALMPLVASSPQLEAVWSHEIRLGSDDILGVFTPTLGVGRASVLSRVVTSVMELSLSQAAATGNDAADIFERDIVLIDEAFAIERATPHDPAPRNPAPH